MSIVLTLAVFGTWILLALGLAAIGVLFLDRVAESEPAWHNLYCAVWAGFALLIAGLMLWHFFLPADGRALLFFSGVAAMALVLERRWFAAVARMPWSRPFAVGLLVFALWTANHALPPGGMDDYTYEFQSIRWFHDYPIVPGLANLHGRLGFNDSHHLFAAMLSVGIWKGAVNHLFNGFFVLLACMLLLGSVRDLAKGGKGAARSLFPALLLCPCASLIVYGRFNPGLSTLKADVFVCAASAVLASLFLRWAAPNGERSATNLVTILLIGSVIPSIKISTVVFCGLLVGLAAVRSLPLVARGTMTKRTVYGALAVATVIAICFPVRGMILSGYPFYPATAFGWNADWRVPAAQAEAERAYVTSYARLQPTYDPREVSGWKWVRGWARSTAITDRVNLVLPLMLAMVCVPLLFAKRRADAGASTPAWAYGTLAGVSVAALAVWFAQAPAGRFAIGEAWILFAAVFAWTVEHREWNWTALGIGLAAALSAAALLILRYLQIVDERAAFLMLFAFIVLWMGAAGMMRRNSTRLAALCVLLTLFPFAERALSYVRSRSYATLRAMLWIDVPVFYGPAPDPPVTRQTRSGLTVYDTHTAAYDTPLPNTRYFNPYLELRTDRLRDGFRNSSPRNSPPYGENPAAGYKAEVWERDVDGVRLALRSR
jgi:hypothetical protein